jgi:hemerythrin-like domain-containing protein
MQSVDILKEEHTAVLAVLDQLERAAEAVARGVCIPAEIFTDIGEFVSIFVDRCHHAKEETVLFPVLGIAGAPLEARLKDQHAVGRQLAGGFAAAAVDYSRSRLGSTLRLAAAARAYSAYLRAHIELETNELFPLIGRVLSVEADTAAVQGFAWIEEQRIGGGTHERLHGMIAGFAPRLDQAIGVAATAS